MKINNIPSYNIYDIKHKNNYTKKPLTFGAASTQSAQKVSTSLIKKLYAKTLKPVFSKINEVTQKHLLDGIHWISKTKTMKNITSWVTKKENRLDKLQFGSMVGLSTVLDILYARRALKQKGIEEDRKHTLALNFLATMVFAFAGAMFLDKRLNKITKKIQNRFVVLNKELIKKQNLKGKELDKALKKIDAANNGIRIFKNTVIIAIVYRFTGPVLATPAADKLTKFMKKHGWIKEPVVSTNNQKH